MIADEYRIGERPDLLPCPFCGETDFKLFEYIDDRPDVFYQCNTCTTTGPNGGDKESATIQWNTRPQTHRAYNMLSIAYEAIKLACQMPARVAKTQIEDAKRKLDLLMEGETDELELASEEDNGA